MYATDRFYKGNVHKGTPPTRYDRYSYESGTKLCAVDIRDDGQKTYHVNCLIAWPEPIHRAIEKHFGV